MNFNELHGLVEVGNHLFVIRHPARGVGNQHRVDARVSDDADAPRGNGAVGACRLLGGTALIAPDALLREPLAPKTRHGRHDARVARNGFAPDRLAEHDAPQDRSDPGDRHGLIHVFERDVVGPGVFERKDPHLHLFGHHGLVSGGRSPDLIDVGRGAPDGKEPPFARDRNRELRRNAARVLERRKKRLARSTRNRDEFLLNASAVIEMNRPSGRVIGCAVRFAHCSEEVPGLDCGEAAAHGARERWIRLRVVALRVRKAFKNLGNSLAVRKVAEGLLKGSGAADGGHGGERKKRDR